MNNIENMPAEIFDWIRQRSFEQLSPEQQKQVTVFIAAAEYNDMHHVETVLAGIGKTGPVSRKPEIRKDLMGRFSEKHPAGKIRLLSSGDLFWKVAAVFLAICLPVSAWFLFKSNKQLLSGQGNERVDTVYLESRATSNPLKIYDTVYIVKETESRKGKKTREQQINKNPVDEVDVMITNDLNIHSIGDLNSVPNKRKRNNIKDDSLISNYHFVTL